MSRTRNELSKKSPYYLPKHRILELEHFCLQYNDWEGLYLSIDESIHGDEKEAVLLADLSRAMRFVEDVALDTDEVIGPYIFISVTDGVPYHTLKTVHDIPCGKEYFYKLRRKFFWLLSEKKGI